jgi:hypothetical protein
MIAGSKLNDVAFTFGKLGKMPLGNCRFAFGASCQPNMNRPNERKPAPDGNVNLPVPDFVIGRLLHIRRQMANHNPNPFSLKTTERFGMVAARSGENNSPRINIFSFRQSAPQNRRTDAIFPTFGRAA